MTKIKTAKELAKDILTEPKDFNLDNFCKTEVGTFFERILEYLKTHSKPYPSHFLKQTKCMNPSKIIEAITKIVPKLNPTLLNNVSLEVISSCFSYFLHPETPGSVRTPCVQLYLNILSSIKTDWLFRMNDANVSIIPFNLFGRTHNEHVNFEKFITKKNTPIIIYDKPQGTQEDCLINLEKTYQWVNTNWAYGKTDMCKFLFQFILSVIYHDIAIQSGYTEVEYGFDNPVIEEFHVKTLVFLNQCHENELDLQPMFETKPFMSIIIKLLECTLEFKSAENVVSTLTFYTKIMPIESLISHLISVDKEQFLTIPFTATKLADLFIGKNCNDPNKGKVLAAMLKFLIATFTMIYKTLDDEIYTYLHSYFEAFQNNHRIAAFMYAAFIQRLMMKHETDSKPYEFLMELASKSDLYSAISCKYAQMVADMQIPTLLEIPQLDEAISFCSTFYNHRVKNITPEKYDFFIENLADIIDHPNTIVMEKFKSMWAPLDSFDLIFDGLELPPPPIGSLSEEEFSEIAQSFITPFDAYSNKDDDDDKLRTFAPILTYYNTLQILSTLPPGCQCNSTAVFAFSRKRLFTAMLNELHPLILSRSVQVMTAMIAHEEIVPKLDAESLTCWYSVIGLLLLSKDEVLLNPGIEAFTQSIKCNFPGVTCLIPLFLSLLEIDHFPISFQICDIVSSFPLFEVDHSLPVSIIQNLNGRIVKNPSQFPQKAIELLSIPGTKLRSRLVDWILRTFNKAKTDSIMWNYILSVVPSFIANEIVQKNPSPENLGAILMALSNSMKEQNLYAVDLIRAQMMVIPKIAQFAPKEMKEFIATSSSYAQNTTDFEPNWTIGYLEIITILFIYNFQLMKNEASYHSFVSSLYKIFSTKVSNSRIGQADIQEFAGSMLKMLSIYFGAFPFHNSDLYPTSKFECDDQENSISTRTGFIIEMSSTDSSTTMASQTPVGRFVWDLTPVTHEFYVETPSLPATLPTVSATPPTVFKAQEELNSTVDVLIKSFEADLGELPLFNMPEEFNDDFASVNESFNAAKVPPLIPIRPPTQMENIKAGAITSTGIFRPSHPHDIKDIAVEQFQIPLHNLATTNHRVLQKFGVLYIGKDDDDYISILSSQIDETSAQFRDFVHQLGWTVDTANHNGYEAELDLTGDRTGQTAIYYADFTREAIFHVPALFKKELMDQSQNFRRRFISNDNIIVVWTENENGFDPTIIYQKPNILFIVLSPTETNLIRVQLLSRSGFTLENRVSRCLFISKEMVPSFVRSTCFLAADKYARREASWKHPVISIGETITEVISNVHSKALKDYTSISAIMSTRSNSKNSLTQVTSQESYW